MVKSILRIIISNVAGFLIFLIILAFANLIVPNVNGINTQVNLSVLNFFNSSIIFFLILFIIGLLNEIFWNFYFPFNIIAPIISSIFSIFVISFLNRIWDIINGNLNMNVVIPFYILYIFIPLIVLIAGYLIIMVRGGKPREDFHEKHRINIKKHKERMKRHIKELDREVKNINWEDVGDEFKEGLYNLGKSINNLFEGKEKSSDRKKKKGRP